MKSLPEHFSKNQWHIGPVRLGIAREMVATYHYAKHGSTWGVYTFGLFLVGNPQVWGITWWLPAPKLSVDKYNPGGYKTTLILSRMVIHPDVPSNAASFLLSASVKEIAKEGRYTYLMTYADTWKGHTGAVYKAANWDYEGMSKPTPIWLDQDGILVSAYRSGRIQSRQAMLSKGYRLLGCYPKHIYTLQLKAKPQLLQLELFPAA